MEHDSSNDSAIKQTIFMSIL